MIKFLPTKVTNGEASAEVHYCVIDPGKVVCLVEKEETLFGDSKLFDVFPGGVVNTELGLSNAKMYFREGEEFYEEALKAASKYHLGTV